jgi:ribose 5-phosphate isomerase A
LARFRGPRARRRPPDRETTVQDQMKRQAAERAAAFVEDGMTLGLGTGSTVRHLLDVLAEGRREGRWQRIVGIPTSIDTERRAEALGIPLTTLEEHPQVDLTIDGADQVDPDLNLIKGLGGALLREKIVAWASRQLVIVADDSKRAERLGGSVPLPVEVDPFGSGAHDSFFRELGANPVLRRDDEGDPVRSDGDNLLVDLHFTEGIPDVHALERLLQERPGVLETGLFLGRTTAVVYGTAEGAEVVSREDAR